MKNQEFPPSTTIGELAVQDVNRIPVLEKYNIDYCCNGDMTLEAACKEADIQVDQLIDEMLEHEKHAPKSKYQFKRWGLDFLIDYILNTHHEYIKSHLPIMKEMTAQAIAAHASDHPELSEIQSILQEVTTGLEEHMHQEEEILFPFVKQLVKAEHGEGEAHTSHFGTVANPIHMMIADHDQFSDAFKKIQQLTNGYQAHDTSCTTCVKLFKELKEFQDNLHQHIHLENNLLFPRAKGLEQQLMFTVS